MKTISIHTMVLGGILAATLLGGCNKATSPESTHAPEVEVADVISKEINLWDEFNGRVSAVQTVDIRPRVTGYITQLAYTEGREVQQGDLLFVIDQRLYKAALASAEAQLERARASVHLSKIQDERAQSLAAMKAASQEDADIKKTAYEQSVSDLHAAEAAVQTAMLNLEYTKVYSPIRGRTSRAMITMGNLAVADQTILTTVVSQDPVYVYFNPDEHSFLRYRNILKRKGAESPLDAHIGLANDPGFPYLGKVSFIDNQVDPATGTIRARAVVRNPDRVFTPGLFARVQFSDGEHTSALLLDDKAVLTDQNRKYVYVLGSGNKAIRKDIKPGRLVDGLRVINSGLLPQDKVIVTGLHQIYASGTLVTPRPAKRPAANPELPNR
jgi:membrane fusion protein, multidrug efflux system